MGLISLVYVSYESHELSDEEIKDILETAREFNSKHNITGMLLYRDGFFIQALEGEEDTVMSLYRNIREDDRHKNVITVYKNDIHERSFDSWAMGFNRITDEDLKNMEGYTAYLEEEESAEDFFTRNPDRAHRLLENFRDQTYF